MPGPEIDLPGTIVPIEGYVWLEKIGAKGFTNNEFAGTRGESRRMEGFELNLVDPPGTLGLRYCVHVEEFGWMDWVDGGRYAGTKNKGLRCEAFEIEITGDGPDPLGYMVEYMAHMEGPGDIGPYHDGHKCGSEKLGLRLEGMAVTIRNEVGQIQQP